MKFFDTNNTRNFTKVYDTVSLTFGGKTIPEGYLIVDAIGTNPGIQQYLRMGIDRTATKNDLVNVYRPQSVFDNEDTRKSAQDKDVTIGHVSVDATNNRDVSVGHIRNMSGNKVSLIIKDIDAIKRIESGELCELSFGYTSEVVPETGSFNGINYEYKFDTNMIINHIALCGRGESRTNAPILTDNNNDNKGILNMKIEKKGDEYVLLSDDNEQIAKFKTKKQAEAYMTDMVEKLKDKEEVKEETKEEVKAETKAETKEEAKAEPKKEEAKTEAKAEVKEEPKAEAKTDTIDVKQIVKDTILEMEKAKEDSKIPEMPSNIVAYNVNSQNYDVHNVSRINLNDMIVRDEKGNVVRNLYRGRESELAGVVHPLCKEKNWYQSDMLVRAYDLGILDNIANYIVHDEQSMVVDTAYNKVRDDLLRHQFNNFGQHRDSISNHITSRLSYLNKKLLENWIALDKTSQLIATETVGDMAGIKEFIFTKLDVTADINKLDEHGNNVGTASIDFKQEIITASATGLDVPVTDEMLAQFARSGWSVLTIALRKVSEIYNRFKYEQIIVNGLLKDTNIERVDTAKWEFGTEAQRDTVRSDLCGLIEKVWTKSDERLSTFSNVYIALPRAYYSQIMATPLGTPNGNNNGLSIADWVKMHNVANVNIRFVSVPELDTIKAGKNGVLLGVVDESVASYAEKPFRLTRTVQETRQLVLVHDAMATTHYIKNSLLFTMLEVAQ